MTASSVRGALAASATPPPALPWRAAATARDGAPARRTSSSWKNLVDHTNVGAAFRSAAALGVDAVPYSQCADPAHRRSVRLDGHRFPGGAVDPPGTLARRYRWLHRRLPSLCRTIPFLDDFLQRCPFSKGRARLAVVMGTEATAWQAHHRRPITIKTPMDHGRLLNVAAACRRLLGDSRDRFPRQPHSPAT